MSPDVEFLVVGGGLAGTTVANRLAREGRNVLIVERSDFPRDKLCGEFLSPESQTILRDLEILGRVDAASPARIRRARFVGSSGRTVAVKLPATGYGISRKRLDVTLFDAARAAGADAWTGSEVTGLAPAPGGGHRVDVRRADESTTHLVAKTVVCAHGRRGRPDRALSRAFLDRRHPFIGLKRHHRPAKTPAGAALAAELDDHVEIYPFRGGYCGMSFIETGEVNVCLLADESVVRGKEKGWDAILALSQAYPPLHARLSALTATDPQPLAVASVPFTPKSRYERGVFFVGDAAGMIAPLAGDGQAMALDSGRQLAELLLAASLDGADLDPLGAQWDRMWRRAYGVRMALAHRLQRWLLHPTSAEWTIGVVGAIPGLPDLLGRMTRGHHS